MEEIMKEQVFDLHFTLCTAKAEDGTVFSPYEGENWDEIFSAGTEVEIWEDGKYYKGIIKEGYDYMSGEIKIKILEEKGEKDLNV